MTSSTLSTYNIVSLLKVDKDEYISKIVLLYTLKKLKDTFKNIGELETNLEMTLILIMAMIRKIIGLENAFFLMFSIGNIRKIAFFYSFLHSKGYPE